MTADLGQEPWRDLAEILETGDEHQLEAYLDGLSATERARAVSRLSMVQQTELLTSLSPDESAHLIEDIPDPQAADLIQHLDPMEAAAIVEEMQSDQKADLLAGLTENDTEAILLEMVPEEAESVRQLLHYPADTAGGLMITEYLAYAETLAVSDVARDLRGHSDRYRDYDVQYIYVISQTGTLTGVLRLRDLLLSSETRSLAAAMIADPIGVRANATLAEVREVLDGHRFLAVPVTDEAGHLVGVIQRAAVEKATTGESNKAFLESSGIVGGEELRSMGFFRRSSRRLSWLSINILLNIVAASVIAFYQETLQAVIVLAIFLPIISDMSGCSGNQAVAVSIRELTLGLVKPRELFRVILKESSIGIFNGMILGTLLGLVAGLWQMNAYLGLVVGGALMANTLLAVCLGGAIPLVLRGLKMDPALASGPILTTVTDMCGFFLVLSFASLLLARLAS